MTCREDLRQRVVFFVEQGGGKTEAARRFGVSRSSIYGWLEQLPAPLRPARKTRRGKLDMNEFKDHLEQHPDAYQHERAAVFGVTGPAIHYALKRLKMTRKKTMRYLKKKPLAPDKGFAFEPGDECRNQYLETLSQIPEQPRVYVDETGFNEPLIREYGYAEKGVRVEGERTGKRFARASLIAGLKNNKPVAPMEFKGHCDTEVVLAWVKEMLIPKLSAGDVLIWDNATVHRSPR